MATPDINDPNEQGTTSSTLHINVANQLGISGSFPMTSTGLGPNYTCPLGTFLMESNSSHGSGSGNSLNLSGEFTIKDVGDDYGNVKFSGSYVSKGGNGSGNVSWDGNHAPRTAGGSDPWTSDTTTPEPDPPDAQS